jgi:hypothetical protein
MSTASSKARRPYRPRRQKASDTSPARGHESNRGAFNLEKKYYSSRAGDKGIMPVRFLISFFKYFCAYTYEI